MPIVKTKQTELQRVVGTALDAGLSLEETVKRLQMADYQDYSLYAFAHRQVNVPALCRDLQSSE